MRMPERQDPTQGVLLAVAAFTCFVLADSCLKGTVPLHLPAYEITGLAGLLEMALLLLWFSVRGGLRGLWPQSPLRALARASLDLINNLGVVVALRHLPLALFYILVFLAPAVTTLGEALLLRERLGWKRAAAVVLGFGGVVVAVDPFHAGGRADAAGVLACMVCVACFSVNMVWSRTIMRDERPEAMTFFSSLLQGAVGVVLMLLWHAAAVPVRGWELLGGVAAVSMVGGLCFFLALRHTTAATVSQYHYTQLVTGAAVAYAVWRERPTLAMWAGAVLIVASGWLAAAIVRTRPVTIPEL